MFSLFPFMLTDPKKNNGSARALSLLCLAAFACLVVAVLSVSWRAIDAVEAARYQGASGCAQCHQKEFDIWSKTKHAGAFDSIPLERRRDLTCLWCHATDARDNYRSFKLKGVQCEACHGKGTFYAYGTVSKDFISRHKRSLRGQDETVCLDCHSAERSPAVGAFDYKKKREKIKHWK